LASVSKDEVAERSDLTDADKQRVLETNAERFFRV